MKKGFGIAFVAILLSSCGVSDGGPRMNLCGTPGGSESVEAFKATLQPELQRHCSQCHTSISPQAPGPFADDSPSIAYPIALQYVDFANPSSSIFVQRMNQQHNCASAGCTTLADQFTDSIEAWAAQHSGAPSSPGTSCSDTDDARTIVTSARSVPTSLTGSQTLTLSFPLTEATPPVSNAVFQVTVRRFTSESGSGFGSYQIQDPILAIAPQGGSELNERISLLALLIGGRVNPSYRAWLSTDFVVDPRPFSMSSPLSGWFSVNPSPQIVDWGSSTSDSISFSFRLSRTSSYPTVPEVNPFNCKRVDLFARFYNAKSGDCLGCHGNVGSPAFTIFPMASVADSATCQNFKQRSNLGDYFMSLFYLMPQNLVSGRQHPVTILFNATDQQNIRSWLDNEQ